MLELPEAAVMANQLNASIKGKKIRSVVAAQTPHKFAFFAGDPNTYKTMLAGKKTGAASSLGGMVEIKVEDRLLLFGDGVNLRFHGKNEPRPHKHQVLIEFDDDSGLSGAVQMYGGLWCLKQGPFENPYHIAAKSKPSPLIDKFSKEYFLSLFDENSGKLSLKAFLATEQRIPGLGNGVLQDILFNAGMHPKKKVSALSEKEKRILFDSIKSMLAAMTQQGGRDTEKDLYGNAGGYVTKVSKNTVDSPCAVCGTFIKKEAYMGGSIYYCSKCQKL